MRASIHDVPSEYVPPTRERTNWDWRSVAVETGECIACGRALLRGERIACSECKALAQDALGNPVALAKLVAMAHVD
jgi:hypothetical protein